MKSADEGEFIVDREKGLHLLLHKNWLKETDAWWDTFVKNVRWYRVKYKSNRFGKECETPCWTTFYGGRECVQPYIPVPSWLQPLVDQVSALQSPQWCNVQCNAGASLL